MSVHVSRVRLRPETFPSTDHYPFSLPVFQETPEIAFDGPVTFFIGENGSGKSTLLEAIALAAGIHIWRREEGSRYLHNPHEKQLHRHLRLEWTGDKVPGSYFGSEIYNDFRKIVDNWAASDPGQLKYFGGKSLVAQSHGQSIMSYFRSRYKIKGLYFLDEPETALSPKSQLELLDILREYGRAGHAQFLIATHSPVLLTYEDARVYSFDHSPVREVCYEDTEHFRIFRRLFAEEGR